VTRARPALAAVVALAAAAAACGDDRPPGPTGTRLALRVTADGAPIAARVLLVDEHGQPLRIGVLDLYDTRQGAGAIPLAPDVVGTWDGIIVGRGVADLPVGDEPWTPAPVIPFGRYHVVAWHGIDFERWEGDVDLSADRGRVELSIALDRAWTAPGTLAADLHVHALGSLDSNTPLAQRVVAQVAGGVQVIGLSNHDVIGSVADQIRELGLGAIAAAIPSVELSSDYVHLNVYPAAAATPLPAAAAIDPMLPAQLFGLAASFPDHPIVQVNHPRFRDTALFDTFGWDGVSWPPPFPRAFDALEVLNGFNAFDVADDRRIDQCVRDFYTLTDHGWLITPVGNSDSHDFNWVTDGVARTFVYVPDARTEPFDRAAFVDAIRARRTVATTGPWLDVTAAPREGAAGAGPGQVVAAADGAIWLGVRVSRARFVKVDRIRVTIGSATGPETVETIAVPPGERTYAWRGPVEVGAADTWVGVTADGDSPLPLDQTGTYQRDKWGHPGVTPFAIISPILVDADGDGRWRRGDADLSSAPLVQP